MAEGAAVEQHLLTCAQCRARVNAAATAVDLVAVDLVAVWDRTRDAVEVPRPSVFERLLRAAGLPAHEARLVAVASAFRGAWLALGAAAVLAFAALAAAAGHARGLWYFLAAAPLAPCLVVAFSYDRRMDPASRTGDGHAVSGAAAGLAAHDRGARARAACCAAARAGRAGARRPSARPPPWRSASSRWSWPRRPGSARWPRPWPSAPPGSRWSGPAAARSASPAAWCSRPGSRWLFLVLAAASSGIFLLRRGQLRLLRPWR